MADGATARMTIADKGRADTVVDLDVALIERARKGDSRAFERLYRDHVGRVHGLCLRMTRNPDLAADCAQDAFIKAWKALPRFEARSSFFLQLIEPEPGILDVEGDESLQRIGLGTRDVLVLCGVYGYEHSEAASMLGIAVGTCKAQLHRARGLLRDRLERGVK